MSEIENTLPLWKAASTGETAKAAAIAIRTKAPTLRERVLHHLETRPATPEMLLAKLQEDGIRTVLTSVRPRCSELLRQGLIADSGLRGRGEGGCSAIIWRATTEDERSLFRARKAAAAEHGEDPHG